MGRHINTDFSAKIMKLAPREVKTILGISRAAAGLNMKVFLTGGFARDIVTGRPDFDIDCVTDGSAEKLGEKLAKYDRESVLTVNRKFLTVKLSLNGLAVDIASARKETYERPGSLPAVTPASIEDDSYRRDFTINALRISINKNDFGKLRSPEKFLKDLKNGIIQVFHKNSFRDDPTRIYRALRFASRFGFSLDPATKKLMNEALRDGYLEKISSFRSMRELSLLLGEPDASEALALIFKMKIEGYIMPGVKKSAVADLKYAQHIWFDFFIYLYDRADVTFFYLLIILRGAPDKLRKTLADRFVSGAARRKQVMFPERKLGSIIKRAAEGKNDWSFPLDAMTPEMLMYIVFAAERKKLAGRSFRKRVLDYILRLRFKKPFHSGKELLRMGFRGRTIGEMHRLILKRRRSGKITSKQQEYDFLVRKLKKI